MSMFHERETLSNPLSTDFLNIDKSRSFEAKPSTQKSFVIKRTVSVLTKYMMAGLKYPINKADS